MSQQTHLWCEDGRTNRCGLDPLGDHHTHQPDEVTCFACRALLAEDREDMKSAALVAAQRALREAREERDELWLIVRGVRRGLLQATSTAVARAARIAELEKELNSVRALHTAQTQMVKDAEQRTAVGRESNRELEKKLDFVQALHEGQKVRLLEALRRACSWAADQGLDEDTSEHCRPLWLDDAEVAIAAAEVKP